MKRFRPKQIIINNPDNLCVARYHLDCIIEEATTVKNNALDIKSSWKTLIDETTHIVDENRTETLYGEEKINRHTKISTFIKGNILLIDLKEEKQLEIKT